MRTGSPRQRGLQGTARGRSTRGSRSPIRCPACPSSAETRRTADHRRLPLRRSGADDHAAGEDRDGREQRRAALCRARDGGRQSAAAWTERRRRGPAQARQRVDVEVGAVSRDRRSPIGRPGEQRNVSSRAGTRRGDVSPPVLVVARRHLAALDLLFSCCRSARIWSPRRGPSGGRPQRRSFPRQGCTCSRTRTPRAAAGYAHRSSPTRLTTHPSLRANASRSTCRDLVDDLGVPLDVVPPGPARQRESVSVTRSTDSRWRMKRGRFSRLRQKRYSSPEVGR